MDPTRRWMALLALSGATTLAYETIWLRRLSLYLGASAPAATATVVLLMGGLALGGLLADRWKPRRAARAYAALEGFAALWAIALPRSIAIAEVLPGGARLVGAAALILPPALTLGATWPLVARAIGGSGGAAIYAANTAGAVAGVLVTTFAAIPLLGVRGAELLAALLGLATAVGALSTVDAPAEPLWIRVAPRPGLLVAGAASGFVALGLEVCWMRLAAVAFGATVFAFAWVLAVFLAASALGAAWGRRWPADPERGLVLGLAAVGGAALLGGLAWGALPYALAWGYATGGPDAVPFVSAALAAIAMGGAPAASGVVFSSAARLAGRANAPALYGWNGVGSVLGSVAAAVWAVPALGLSGALAALALVAGGTAAALGRRPWPLLVVAVLVALVPRWDARLYAVGIYLRMSDFADASPAAVRAFADEGWDLLSYEQGRTGAVAVGRSRKTGNTWLSINGKVDASTGDDMPTQELSAQLPIRMASRAVEDVLVVGLASGVTAGAALAEPGVRSLAVVELEPEVVAASRFFDAVNRRPLADGRTELVVDDARGWLARTRRSFDVIVSEPSNPWITGVSSLFTEEYWELLRAHLREGGVVCQWVQLYGMGTEELRGLLRTFTAVFPDTRLFVSVAGSDVLLIGGTPRDGLDLPLAPWLDAEGIRCAAGEGWRNTDDRPIVEWSAPWWLHYDTAPANVRLLDACRSR